MTGTICDALQPLPMLSVTSQHWIEAESASDSHGNLLVLEVNRVIPSSGVEANSFELGQSVEIFSLDDGNVKGADRRDENLQFVPLSFGRG